MSGVVDVDWLAERRRTLILLLATLETAAERLESLADKNADTAVDDLGLLVRVSDLQALVKEDLQRLAGPDTG